MIFLNLEGLISYILITIGDPLCEESLPLSVSKCVIVQLLQLPAEILDQIILVFDW